MRTAAPTRRRSTNRPPTDGPWPASARETTWTDGRQPWSISPTRPKARRPAGTTSSGRTRRPYSSTARGPKPHWTWKNARTRTATRTTPSPTAAEGPCCNGPSGTTAASSTPTTCTTTSTGCAWCCSPRHQGSSRTDTGTCGPTTCCNGTPSSTTTTAGGCAWRRSCPGRNPSTCATTRRAPSSSHRTATRGKGACGPSHCTTA